MPSYEYRCGVHGAFEVRCGMTERPAVVGCPTCGVPAVRQFGGPALLGLPVAVVEARDRAERSRESPDVVSTVPASRAPRVRTTYDPRHLRLPRS